MTTPKDVQHARDLIIGSTRAAKANVIAMLEGGHRDWSEFRNAVEKYIDLQRAADVLGGSEKFGAEKLTG